MQPESSSGNIPFSSSQTIAWMWPNGAQWAAVLYQEVPD